MAAGGSGLLGLWREENDALALRWRRATSSGCCSAARTARECQGAFAHLLQRVQGLPAVLPALPLELTVLYNSLLFNIHLSTHPDSGQWPVIDHALARVLEACVGDSQGVGSEDCWRRVLQGGVPEELQPPLQQLAALQVAFCLASNRLGLAEGLLRLLNGTKGLPAPSSSPCDSQLLLLLQIWHPPEVQAGDPLTVQSLRDLKDVLWTSAAVLQVHTNHVLLPLNLVQKLQLVQNAAARLLNGAPDCADITPVLKHLYWLPGVRELEDGRLSVAISLLQAAATGLCSKRVLAQIFTLIGCCNLKMGKPQMAMQHLKQALQVDFTFLPALHQAALLYRQLGHVEAELEAMTLLSQVLDGPGQVTAMPVRPAFLVHTELLTSTQLAGSFVQNCPSEVKYLLAQRSLQAGKAGEAVEHYLDLLALLQEGFLHQWGSSSPLPRIPEIFLEAASALEMVGRHKDAVTVCEEVVAHTSKLIPEKLRIELGAPGEPQATGLAMAKSPAGLTKQEKEGLCCVIWQGVARLIQGSAWAELGDTKEAVTCFSRCLNDLLKVHLVSRGNHSDDRTEQLGLPELKAFSKIRQLALTGRGAKFLEMGQDKQALMDFQHSLHACQDNPTANLYLLHTLWKLQRRPEAAAQWQKLRLNPALMEEETERSLPLYLLSCMKQMKFPDRDSVTRNMEEYFGER